LPLERANVFGSPLGERFSKALDVLFAGLDQPPFKLTARYTVVFAATAGESIGQLCPRWKSMQLFIDALAINGKRDLGQAAANSIIQHHIATISESIEREIGCTEKVAAP
jgi:hypothetical protein